MRPDLLIGVLGVVLIAAAVGGIVFLETQTGEGLPRADFTVTWETGSADLDPATVTVAENGRQEAAFEVPRGNVSRFVATVRCTDNFQGSVLPQAQSTLTVTLRWNNTDYGSGSAACGAAFALPSTGPCAHPGSMLVAATSRADALAHANVTGAACPDGMGAWTVVVQHARAVGAPAGGGVTVTLETSYEWYHSPTAAPVTLR